MPGFRYDGLDRVDTVRPAASYLDLNGIDLSTAIENAVDRTLREAIGSGAHPVLLFSGGVDSGFIASRLVACGFNDSLLLNYSFGDDDRESQLAESMATYLGLPFGRIQSDGDSDRILMSPGTIYAQPFGDHSALPTSQLAFAAIDRVAGEARLILDGTGADGAFGKSPKIQKWSQVAALPRPVGTVASAAYSVGRLWLRTGRAEHGLRILRRTGMYHGAAGIIAQNALAGILYSDRCPSAVNGMLVDWLDGWSGDSFERHVVGADLALTCSNVIVSKSRPIFTRAGMDVHYPFLSSDVLALALDSVGALRTQESKAPLKRSLATAVPETMVCRPKSGFADPENRVFTSPAFLHHLETATDAHGPIAHLLDASNIRKAIRQLARARHLPPQTLNALWAIVFTDRWYRTALIG